MITARSKRPPTPDYSFARQTYTPASTGITLHRCGICWPEAHPADNGFVPATEPIPHTPDCPAREPDTDAEALIYHRCTWRWYPQLAYEARLSNLASYWRYLSLVYPDKPAMRADHMRRKIRMRSQYGFYGPALQRPYRRDDPELTDE